MEQIKVKILNMTYYQEEHLFVMEVNNLKTGIIIKLSMRATDFNIPKEVPLKIINNFCEMMKGKEKNLFINKEGTSIEELKKGGKEISEEDLYKLHSDLDQFPFFETERIIKKQNEN